MSRENISDEFIIESDIELDESYVVAPDNDFEEMGYPTVEVSEENQEAAEVLKSYALNAICERQLVEAKDHLTEAIMLNPKSALLFASRATCYVKLKKPNAAIRDVDVALQINPDLAKGYKARGMARAMLGLWEEAATDLNMASKLSQMPTSHRQRYEQLHRECEQRKLELEMQRSEKICCDFQSHFGVSFQQSQDNIMASQSLQQLTTDFVKLERFAAISSPILVYLSNREVIDINDGMELRTKVKAAETTSRLTIIYFRATRCKLCRNMDPIYTTFAGKYYNIVFLTVDIDKLLNVAVAWKSTTIPTFFFVKKSKVVEQAIITDKYDLELKILTMLV
ncbi:hypothetical protein RD792_014909 [Penstemon davidsonii]|uniref:Thioredoxin domain-containing protein n=1 Tax=Penstemon davidsonii TaxID=160366 RepID=A0ABR0CS83_9LAMI|nr:hypothetical protein RD792_014909 [Penstemon davidsonii]